MTSLIFNYCELIIIVHSGKFLVPRLIMGPSWEEYLLKYKLYLGLTDVDVPSIDLYRLLSIVNAEKISIVCN